MSKAMLLHEVPTSLPASTMQYPKKLENLHQHHCKNLKSCEELFITHQYTALQNMIT